MADTDNRAEGGSEAPVFHVMAQYIKDLSFENPGAPRTLSEPLGKGGMNIEVGVNSRPMNENAYEVELAVRAKAENDDSKKVVFNLELVYAALFRIENVPRESLHALLMIEGPRLLFPFARQILADATRNGGFPPLLLDPVDFAALYRQRLGEMQGRTGNA